MIFHTRQKNILLANIQANGRSLASHDKAPFLEMSFESTFFWRSNCESLLAKIYRRMCYKFVCARIQSRYGVIHLK